MEEEEERRRLGQERWRQYVQLLAPSSLAPNSGVRFRNGFVGRTDELVLIFRSDLAKKIHHGMPSSLSLTRRPYSYIPSSRFEQGPGGQIVVVHGAGGEGVLAFLGALGT
jgi:hypothetical protein